MANSLPTSSIVLGELVDHLKEECIAIKGSSLDLGDKFSTETGTTITGKKPSRYDVWDTPDISAKNRETYEDTYTVTTQRAVTAVDLTSLERTYKIDKKAFDKEIQTMASAIGRQINKKFFEAMALYGKRTKRTTYTNGLAYLDAANINAMLGESLAPETGRMIAMSSKDHAYLANDIKGLFNPQANIAKDVEMGKVATMTAGMDWWTNQSLYSVSVATTDVATAAVNMTGGGAFAEGGQSIVMDTTDQAAGAVKKGQAFTVAGCYEIDPQDCSTTNTLKTFIASADATASANAITITLTEKIYTTATNRSVANVSALPANDAAVDFIEAGAAGKAGKLIQAWHPKGIVCAFKPLFKPDSGSGVLVDSIDVDGITMRLIKYWNGDKDYGTTRIDCDFGFGVVFKELLSSSFGIVA